MKKIFSVFLLTCSLSACYYDNTSEMHPGLNLNQNCDTVDVTYTKNLIAIFSSNCGSNNNGCHNAASAQGSVILENYINSTQVNSQLLIGVIEQAPGFKPMPPSGKLSDCKITVIKKWIESGKPQ